MNTKRKIHTTVKTTDAFCCSFCCRHILITFVGMTLLIMNYGVSTAQMSAEQQRDGNCIKSDHSSSKCVKDGDILSLMINAQNYENEMLFWTSNRTVSNFQQLVRPETPMVRKKENTLKAVFGVNQTEIDSADSNIRGARFFGLLGSNFSLSYNLTLSNGNSVGNITLLSPAPTYYYYNSAPSYPYYSYPSAYNPYASSPQYYYDPNTGYIYYF